MSWCYLKASSGNSAVDLERQPELQLIPVEDVRAYIAEIARELADLAQRYGDEPLAEALRTVSRTAEAD